MKLTMTDAIRGTSIESLTVHLYNPSQVQCLRFPVGLNAHGVVAVQITSISPHASTLQQAAPITISLLQAIPAAVLPHTVPECMFGTMRVTGTLSTDNLVTCIAPTQPTGTIALASRSV